jgi:hypothetical protein
VRVAFCHIFVYNLSFLFYHGSDGLLYLIVPGHQSVVEFVWVYLFIPSICLSAKSKANLSIKILFHVKTSNVFLVTQFVLNCLAAHLLYCRVIVALSDDELDFEMKWNVYWLLSRSIWVDHQLDVDLGLCSPATRAGRDPSRGESMVYV